jgi:uroporphyrinogen-III decarboxylase
MEDIRSLLESYLSVVGSKRNQANKQSWENADERYLHERWRGRSLCNTNAPFTMAMDISGYCQVLGFSCADYYQNPESHLREQLRYALWEAHHFDCQRYFEDAVFVAQGSVFEASWFGAGIRYLDAQAPWYDEKNPVLADKTQLLELKPFNFYSSGLCPTVHRFYQELRRMTAGYPIDVMFPLALRSPFSIAIMLRGFENLLIDVYDDPVFFNDLLETITGYLKEYMQARAAFLDEPLTPGMLFNDEISTPTLSPALYRDMILPFELELSRFAAGLRYWHSCGVTQDFYRDIATIPGLKMMHIGPWSDIEQAVAVFGPLDIALEICVNSVRDMHEKTQAQMERQLAAIKEACDGRVRYSVRCDGIAVISTVEACLLKIKEWNAAATKVFGAA